MASTTVSAAETATTTTSSTIDSSIETTGPQHHHQLHDKSNNDPSAHRTSPHDHGDSGSGSSSSRIGSGSSSKNRRGRAMVIEQCTAATWQELRSEGTAALDPARSRAASCGEPHSGCLTLLLSQRVPRHTSPLPAARGSEVLLPGPRFWHVGAGRTHPTTQPPTAVAMATLVATSVVIPVEVAHVHLPAVPAEIGSVNDREPLKTATELQDHPSSSQPSSAQEAAAGSRAVDIVAARGSANTEAVAQASSSTHRSSRSGCSNGPKSCAAAGVGAGSSHPAPAIRSADASSDGPRTPINAASCSQSADDSPVGTSAPAAVKGVQRRPESKGVIRGFEFGCSRSCRHCNFDPLLRFPQEGLDFGLQLAKMRLPLRPMLPVPRYSSWVSAEAAAGAQVESHGHHFLLCQSLVIAGCQFITQPGVVIPCSFEQHQTKCRALIQT